MEWQAKKYALSKKMAISKQNSSSLRSQINLIEKKIKPLGWVPPGCEFVPKSCIYDLARNPTDIFRTFWCKQLRYF